MAFQWSEDKKQKFWYLVETLRDPKRTWILREIERTSCPIPKILREEIRLDIDVPKIIENLVSYGNSVLVPLGVIPKINFPLMKIEIDHKLLPVAPRDWINNLMIEEIITQLESLSLWQDYKKKINPEERKQIKNLIQLLVRVDIDEFPGLRKLKQIFIKELQKNLKDLHSQSENKEVILPFPLSYEPFIKTIAKHFPKTYETLKKRVKEKNIEAELESFFDLSFVFLTSLLIRFSFHPRHLPYLFLIFIPHLLYESPLMSLFEDSSFDLLKAAEAWGKFLQETTIISNKKRNIWELKKRAAEEMKNFIWALLFVVTYTTFAILIPKELLNSKEVLKLTITYEKEYSPVKPVFYFLKLFSHQKCKEIANRWFFRKYARKIFYTLCYAWELCFHIPFTKTLFSRNVIITRPNYIGGRSFHYEVSFNSLTEVREVHVYYQGDYTEKVDNAFSHPRKEWYRIHMYTLTPGNPYFDPKFKADEESFTTSDEKLSVITEIRTRRSLAVYLLTSLILFFVAIYHPVFKNSLRCLKNWNNQNSTSVVSSLQRFSQSRKVIRPSPRATKLSDNSISFHKENLRRPSSPSMNQVPYRDKMANDLYKIALPWLLGLFSLLFRRYFSSQGLIYLLYSFVSTFVISFMLTMVTLAFKLNSFVGSLIAIGNLLLIIIFLWYHRIRFPLVAFRNKKAENLYIEIKKWEKILNKTRREK